MNYCIFTGHSDAKGPQPGAQVTLVEACTTGNGEKFVARKKKAKRFRAVTAVKELARERVGAPPPGQVVIEKKKKPEKHKPTLGKLLEEQ